MNEQQSSRMKKSDGVETQKHPKTKMGKDSSPMKNAKMRKSPTIYPQNQDAEWESTQHPKREKIRCEPDIERFYVNCKGRGDSSTPMKNMTNHTEMKFR